MGFEVGRRRGGLYLSCAVTRLGLFPIVAWEGDGEEVCGF